jgi:hypothetical protein
VCCGNYRKHTNEDFVAICDVIFQRVKRDRLGLYHTLYECGECGCNSECQCECYINVRYADLKLGVLFHAC